MLLIRNVVFKLNKRLEVLNDSGQMMHCHINSYQIRRFTFYFKACLKIFEQF